MAIMKKLVLCVTGMPGSGKSVFVEEAKKAGLPVVVLGDVIREEVEKRGLPRKPEIFSEVAKELRRKYGNAVVAERALPKLQRLLEERGVVVVDGVRGLYEVELFKSKLPDAEVVIVAIHASPKARFERLLKRGRPGDPQNFEEFLMRDKAELELGVGNVIALADKLIVNEGSLEELRAAARHVLREVAGAWLSCE